MPDKSVITVGDRIAAAWVAFMAATLTLLLLPLAICIFSGAVSAKGAGLFVHYYGYVFSKHGLFLLLGATLGGFMLGPDRIATVFSVVWFTHPGWACLSAYLDEKIGCDREHEAPNWLLWTILLVLLGILAWVVA